MIASPPTPRKRGRPKLHAQRMDATLVIRIPSDLLKALRKFQQEQRMLDMAGTAREVWRRYFEDKGIIERRPVR